MRGAGAIHHAPTALGFRFRGNDGAGCFQSNDGHWAGG